MFSISTKCWKILILKSHVVVSKEDAVYYSDITSPWQQLLWKLVITMCMPLMGESCHILLCRPIVLQCNTDLIKNKTRALFCRPCFQSSGIKQDFMISHKKYLFNNGTGMHAPWTKVSLDNSGNVRGLPVIHVEQLMQSQWIPPIEMPSYILYM